MRSPALLPPHTTNPVHLGLAGSVLAPPGTNDGAEASAEATKWHWKMGESMRLQANASPDPSHGRLMDTRCTLTRSFSELVDPDTVVLEDRLRDAAREMAESPEVAIIKHESGELLNPIQPPSFFTLQSDLRNSDLSDVTQVAHHHFENGLCKRGCCSIRWT